MIDPDFPELGRVINALCWDCPGEECDRCRGIGVYKTWPDATLEDLQMVSNKIRTARIADAAMMVQLGALEPPTSFLDEDA